MSVTNQRDHAFQIARSSNDLAFSQAVGISDPWFSCQALSAVLRYAPESRIAPISSRIQRRAGECSDDYCRGAVLAWLIRGLAERDQIAEARSVLASALGFAGRAVPAGSQAEALFLLYQAAHPLGPKCVAPIIQQLISLNVRSPHWRCARAIVWSLAIHSALAPADAERMLFSVRDPKLAARMRRTVALGMTRPRSFF